MQLYRKLKVSLWDSPDFGVLNPMERMMAIYCFTTPQANRIGLFPFSLALAAHHCQLDPIVCKETFVSMLQKLKWKYDEDTSTLYIPTWFKYSVPDNAKAFQGYLKDLYVLSSKVLVLEFLDNFDYLSLVFKDVLMAIKHTYMVRMGYVCHTYKEFTQNQEQKIAVTTELEKEKEIEIPKELIPIRYVWDTYLEKTPPKKEYQTPRVYNPLSLRDIPQKEIQEPIGLYESLGALITSSQGTVALGKLTPSSQPPPGFAGELPAVQAESWKSMIFGYALATKTLRKELLEHLQTLGEYLAKRLNWRVKKGNTISISELCNPRKKVFEELMAEALAWKQSPNTHITQQFSSRKTVEASLLRSEKPLFDIEEGNNWWKQKESTTALVALLPGG